MAATAATSMQMAASRPSILSARKLVKAPVAVQLAAAGAKLASSNYVSSTINSRRNNTTTAVKFQRTVTKAMAESSEGNVRSGLAIDLRGKRAFIAGIADDNGYGWAIAKSLAAAGAEILVGTWVPALNIFETSLRRGKFDDSRVLPDGSLMQITKVYPLDAVFDNPDDVPEDIKTNKRYAGSSKWTVQWRNCSAKKKI